MNWRELVEAVETESLRLSIPLDDFNILISGYPAMDVSVRANRDFTTDPSINLSR